MTQDARAAERRAILTLGEVRVWSLGGQRFRIEWPTGERYVRGYKLARVIAYETAQRTSDERYSTR